MSTLTLFWCLLLVVAGTRAKPSSQIKAGSCGYASCTEYDPEALNVHLVAHSHDDVGWLKTVDQYYFQDVNNVLSSVIPALKQKSDRRFVQVETAFFKKWWQQQNDASRQDTINLVNNGQLEIINAGWSMNDEGAVHYQSTIDQFTLGLRYVQDVLGECARPTVGWQIDTFGHSREQASISARLGFDSMFFARFDYRDKEVRQRDKTTDMLWRGSASLGNTTDIMTSIIHNHYSAPAYFCFDIACNDEPIIDDEESPDFNFQKKVEDFADYIRTQASVYPTNNILITMGDDFRYQSALMNYINMDLLIKGFTVYPQEFEGKPIKVYYSTPSCYTKGVNDYAIANNHNLAIKTDDFLPLAQDPENYWAGYFTSRATSKRFERQSNNLLQITKQLAAVGGLDYENENINSLKEALGVMQHHDAITGTEKQNVADNYNYLIARGVTRTLQAADDVISMLVADGSTMYPFGLDSCLLSNVSFCPQSKSDAFTVIVYNPLSRLVSHPVNIPVESALWSITDPEGAQVVYQVDPVLSDFSYITEGAPSPNNLVFMAANVPPLGFNVYQFEKAAEKLEFSFEDFSYKTEGVQSTDDLIFKIVDVSASDVNGNHLEETASDNKKKLEASQNLKIGYEDTSFEIDDATGLLSSVTMNGVTMEVSQDLLYYSTTDGSGAYIFITYSDELNKIATGKVATTLIEGEVYRGVVQEFSSWAKQIIKVYNDDRSYIEFDWLIGPLDVSDGLGREVVSKFTTSLATEGTFYTDSNGREMIQRKRNHRPTFNYTDERHVPGNYYPVNNRIVLKDETAGLELAVLTDRSEGGSSLHDGELELMIQRACVHIEFDDEHLDEKQYNESIRVRGQHYLILGPTAGNGEKSLAAIQRDVAARKHLAPWTFITDNGVTDFLQKLQFSALTAALPENVQILTLEPWAEGTLLLRLEHLLEKDEDVNLSQQVVVDISTLFSAFTVTEFEEMTLGANMRLDELQRLHWPGSEQPEGHRRVQRDVSAMEVTLDPMEIRTFLVKIA